MEMQQLEARLEEVINNNLVRPMKIDTDTPADKILAMIKGLLLVRIGLTPQVRCVYHALCRLLDLKVVPPSKLCADKFPPTKRPSNAKTTQQIKSRP